MNARSKPSFTRQPKVTKGWEAVRINIVRVFLGTIDGLLYFELNFKCQMPQSWLRWTHHLLRTVGRHAHRGLWDGQDETHTSFPWPSGENSGGVFLGASCGILMRTWYHSNCRSWVPSSDDLPVLVMGNCEILGRQRDSSQPVHSRIRRDLVTPAEALRTRRPLPRQPRRRWEPHWAVLLSASWKLCVPDTALNC